MRMSSGEIERTFLIAQRAIELMRAYGSSASPRSYEVWFTYVSGHKPLMNDAVKRLTSERGTLSDGDIELLYDTYLASQRLSSEAERASSGMLAEIDQVMEMIDLALGSTARYGRSLETISLDLAGPALDRGRVREIIGALVAATRDTVETNRTLETRMKETRGEVETLRETLEAVRVETLTDPLTGIGNRKLFEEQLGKAVDGAAAHETALALVVIDIDFFKRFNDTYGHLTGDQVLRLVTTTMRDQVRTGATLARFGGEEFGIILPGTPLETAHLIAERIRQSVASRELVKRSTGESLGKVTISIGIAAWGAGDTAVSLFERADECLFAAKRTGRNRTVTESDDAALASNALSEVA